MMHSHKGGSPRTAGRNGVLILVVMDEALALETWVKNEDMAVLILVVMDDALALQTTSVAGKTATSLNPCCNG